MQKKGGGRGVTSRGSLDRMTQPETCRNTNGGDEVADTIDHKATGKSTNGKAYVPNSTRSGGVRGS